MPRTATSRQLHPLQSQGFTLIELLVAMGLMVILTTILATFIASARKMYDSSVESTRITSEGRAAFDVIARDIRNISSTASVASLPIETATSAGAGGGQGGEDIRKAGLILRSFGSPNPEGWLDANNDNQFDGFVTDQPISEDPTPLSSASNDRVFLQFFSTARFYNRNREDLDGLPNRFETRLVLVQYFLQRRPDYDGQPLPGAFLIRRIQPWRIIEEEDPNNPDIVTREFQLEPPIQDDICKYVRGVRVYFQDRSFDVLDNDDDADVRWMEALNRDSLPAAYQSYGSNGGGLTTLAPPTNSEDFDGWAPLWEEEYDDGSGAIAVNGLVFALHQTWEASTGPGVGNPREIRSGAAIEPGSAVQFSQKDFLPPTIMIELLITDGTGTLFREMSRVFRIPGAPVQIPKNPNANY